ncbi:3'-5' exoribonuclease domain-containing protein [Leisingera methylohalidivorans]|uniref:3'-5' exoribonuclease domain-containing protein n=1 Tax=Leisingera methylohalidivorans TaxID=133924 RepID=UPI0018D425D4|nr:3'-5' exoribonuclease [Leisingera methylohalidivorans]
MLSFALVYAGNFDGHKFVRPAQYTRTFYRELSPISEDFEPEALEVNGLDRERLISTGSNPVDAMLEAYNWVRSQSQDGNPVFVAYPLSFDWSWMYWYFLKFCPKGSPFGHSRCYDIKTSLAVKLNNPVSLSGKSSLPSEMQSNKPHTHNALDDAIEQAEIFANIFEWERN